MSNLGYDATGIEINPELVKISNKTIRSNMKYLNNNISIYQGSYYPVGFSLSESARKVEDSIDNVMIHKEIDIHNPVPDGTIERNKIDLHSYDIWYAFVWSSQAPSVIDMYKQYSKPSAVMIGTGPQFDDIAKKSGLRWVEKDVYTK